jgi:hypothetical protein
MISVVPGGIVVQEVGADDGFDSFAALGQLVSLKVRCRDWLMPVDD